MVSKSTEIFGLDKIPDQVIIKELHKEIGELKSYVSELQYKLNAKKHLLTKGSPEAMLESNTTLRKRNDVLTKENRRLLEEIIKLKEIV